MWQFLFVCCSLFLSPSFSDGLLEINSSKIPHVLGEKNSIELPGQLEGRWVCSHELLGNELFALTFSKDVENKRILVEIFESRNGARTACGEAFLFRCHADDEKVYGVLCIELYGVRIEGPDFPVEISQCWYEIQALPGNEFRIRQIAPTHRSAEELAELYPDFVSIRDGLVVTFDMSFETFSELMKNHAEMFFRSSGSENLVLAR